MKFFYVLIALSFLVSGALAATPVPFVNQPLVPATVAPGGPAFTLVVNGTGFVTSSTVNWNGSPRATTFLSSSQLKASIYSADIATPGTAAVTVTSPNTPQSNISWLPIRTAAKVSFFSNAEVAKGGWPIGVVAADFNQDGKVDVAAVGGYNSEARVPHHVAVLLGNGNGTFQKPVDYQTTPDPSQVIAADFNGDGILDLATASGLLGDVGLSVFLGNGDGTFQSQTKYNTGLTYGIVPSLWAADFNADGKLDLAFIGGESSDMSIMLGNGDGTFRAPNLINVTTGTGTGAMTVGDFNRDGKLDVAVNGSGCCTVYVSLGNGDGTFQPPALYATFGNSEGIGSADLNGDGILDLVESTATATSVLLGNGDGTFEAAVTYADDGGGVAGLVIADINGDGKLDVVVSHYGTSHISYLLGNGDGTLQNYVDMSATNPGIPSMADFNGDGKLDFAVPDELVPGSGVFVFLQR